MMPDIIKKNEIDLSDGYFKWLCSEISTPEKNLDNYSSLLWALYTTEFYWIIPKDANRVADGLSLRDEYCRTYGIYCDFYLPEWASFLEVMVALARRTCESTFYGEEEPCSSSIFWEMVENADMDSLKNGSFSLVNFENKSDQLVARKYRKDGFGSFFVTRREEFDMRKIEIWYQMSIFLEEKYGF